MLYFDKMRMGDCFMTSLIGPGNTWLLLSITCVTIAGAIWLEQKYAWASRISRGGHLPACGSAAGEPGGDPQPCASFR